jgi:1-acyl-sn-glycerol-3-phosphate acyltransferase
VAADTPTPAPIRALRLARLVVHVVAGCTIAGLVFPLISRRAELRIIRTWSRRLLHILNVRLQVHGRMPGGSAPTLLVSNHVSWLDIWVIHAVAPVRFVAKSDLRKWPVIGWLMARAGTIFIERARRHDTARINQSIAAVLGRPERVGLFPEGTTTDGTHVKPFHPSLFQPALSDGVRIVTAGIRYPHRDGSPNVDASYAGDRSLGESLKLILSQRQLRVELVFAGVVEAAGKTRRELASECHALIVHALSPAPAAGSSPGTASGRRAAAR